MTILGFVIVLATLAVGFTIVVAVVWITFGVCMDNDVHPAIVFLVLLVELGIMVPLGMLILNQVVDAVKHLH